MYDLLLCLTLLCVGFSMFMLPLSWLSLGCFKEKGYLSGKSPATADTLEEINEARKTMQYYTVYKKRLRRLTYSLPGSINELSSIKFTSHRASKLVLVLSVRKQQLLLTRILVHLLYWMSMEKVH